MADPGLLLAEIRTAQEELGRRLELRGLTKEQADPIVVDSQRFAVSLKTARRTGEQRTTHHRQYRRRKPGPVRPGFDDQIRPGLQAAPAMQAIEVLRQLKLLEPSIPTPNTYAPYSES